MKDLIIFIIIAYLLLAVVYFMRSYGETWPGFEEIEATAVDEYDNLINRSIP